MWRFQPPRFWCSVQTPTMALSFQASLLLQHGDPAVAEAFVTSRLAGDHGRAFGTLPPGVEVGRIIERARPAVA